MRGGSVERDDVPGRPSALDPRSWGGAGIAVGALLAVAATVVVFLSDDPRVLRLAVVAGAWGFVLALLATSRRRADPTADSAELRRAHELELAREVAGRRQYELETESRLRRESEEGMRAELAALRRDVAALGGLRNDLAALGALRQEVAALDALRQDVVSLGALRHDLAAVEQLRREVTALGALRQDVAALGTMRTELTALGGLRDDVSGPGGLRDQLAGISAMRAELGQLTELRADVGRLRTELTEQLSNEMFLERVVMRTQSSRAVTTPVAAPVEGPSTRAIDAVSWSDQPPREVTGGWPAVRLEPPVEVSRAAERPVAPPAPAAPATRGYEALQGIRARQAEPAPSWQAAPAPAQPAEAPRRRRRSDDAATAEQLTVERPASAPAERHGWDEPAPAARADLLAEAWPRPPAPLPPEPPRPEPLTVQTPAVPTPGEARLAQILAESGTAAPRSGGRRRHRYREDDEDDDVLGRVLGRH
ncbi:DUF6779 domain-containing protein [Blastococcus sp. TF02A-26]|uniref:DUF6779 domain-containing protein n=1 Tax=Blastococcus sp. TF02A-26 TaxID=2250577 RepID=UPI000DE875EC|nr:DUF6779 domain-containing protein [Blastococcus sp. TF02A-26]RBY84192.1 hypothetical protein DQ240_15185 [Blastococcus sp. TF02A-26]